MSSQVWIPTGGVAFAFSITFMASFNSLITYEFATYSSVSNSSPSSKDDFTVWTTFAIGSLYIDSKCKGASGSVTSRTEKPLPPLH